MCHMKTYVRAYVYVCVCMFVRQHAKRTTGHKTQSQVNYRRRPYLRCRKFVPYLFPLSRALHTIVVVFPVLRTMYAGHVTAGDWRNIWEFVVAVVFLPKTAITWLTQHSNKLLFKQTFHGASKRRLASFWLLSLVILVYIPSLDNLKTPGVYEADKLEYLLRDNLQDAKMIPGKWGKQRPWIFNAEVDMEGETKCEVRSYSFIEIWMWPSGPSHMHN